MKMSTRTRYGFRFMVFLAANQEEGKRIQIHKVASQEDISEKYLEQIVTSLKQKRLVNVQRGPRGGYTLTRDPSEITAFEIMSALEGDSMLVDCPGLVDDCRRKETCSMSVFWQDFSDHIENFLKGKTLDAIASQGSPGSPAGAGSASGSAGSAGSAG